MLEIYIYLNQDLKVLSLFIVLQFLKNDTPIEYLLIFKVEPVL